MRLFGLILLFSVRVMYGQVEVPENTTVLLNGEWDLVLNEFLTADQINQFEPAKVNVPGSWNGISWQNEKFSGKGYGTYFKSLHLPAGTDDMIIYMPAVGLSYRVYINDFEIGHVGTPGVNSKTTISKVKPTIFRIPNRFKGESVILIIHISNFSHQNGGLWYAPEVGNAEYFQQRKIRSVIINLVVLGSILIIMLYHFFIYVLRPKEHYSFYFALVCFCLLIHITTQGDIALAHLFPDISWQVIFKLAYSSLIMVGGLNLSFIQKLYPSLIPSTLSRYVILGSLAFATIIWLIPTTISYYLVAPFQILVIVIGLYLTGVLTIAARRELSGASILLVGFAFTFITAIHDILNSQFLIESIATIHFGVFIYTLTLSMVLAKKFVRFINANERLKYEVGKLNDELEIRVASRTSELHSQQELVRDKNIKLELANEELNQLMTILAHDLKSPLLNINSLSQMMKDHLDGPLHESNEMMQKIALNGVAMIDSLISLKKLENEDVSAGIRKFNLSEALTIKVAEFAPQAKNKRQKIFADIQSGIEIRNSERHLCQIIDNLLSNAIKFSVSESTIELKLQQIENQIEISVKDEGPGFSDTDKAKMFGKFQKLSARPTAGETSSGLGLSIVKLLTEKLGGTIGFESVKGKGTTFFVRFPL